MKEGGKDRKRKGKEGREEEKIAVDIYFLCVLFLNVFFIILLVIFNFLTW